MWEVSATILVPEVTTVDSTRFVLPLVTTVDSTRFVLPLVIQVIKGNKADAIYLQIVPWNKRMGREKNLHRSCQVATSKGNETGIRHQQGNEIHDKILITKNTCSQDWQVQYIQVQKLAPILFHSLVYGSNQNSYFDQVLFRQLSFLSVKIDSNNPRKSRLFR